MANPVPESRGWRKFAESLLPGLGLRLLCDILQGLEFAPRSGSIRKPRDLGGKHFCSQVPRGQIYLLQINLSPMSLEAKLFALKQIKVVGMVCLPEADAPGRRLIHRPTLQGWLDPGSSHWSAWFTVLTQLTLQRVRKPASAGFRRTPRMPSLRPPWRVSEPQSEKVQAAQQGGHQGVTGTSLEGSSCKDPPEGGRNY